MTPRTGRPFAAAPFVFLSVLGAAMPANSAGAQVRDPREPRGGTLGWQPTGEMPGAGPWTRVLATTTRDPGSWYSPTTAGVARSADRGAGWEVIAEYPDAFGLVPLLALAPSEPERMVLTKVGNGSIHVTSDAGRHWFAPAQPPVGQFTTGAAFDPVDPLRVLFTTEQGLFESIDGGSHFDLVFSASLGFPSFPTLLFDPNNRRRIYLGSVGTLYVSEDGGATWDARSLPANPGFALEVDPSDGRRLLYGSDGAYLSEDAGRSWTFLGLSGSFVESTAFDVGERDHFYAGRRDGSVFDSVDAGASWTQRLDPEFVRLGNAAVIASDPAHPGDVLIGGAGGMFRSTDHGRNFVRSNSGFESNAYVTALVVDPFDPLHLVAKTGGSAFTSVDGGAHWAESAVEAQFLGESLEADPHVPGRFFAAGSNDRFWRSDDGGQSFHVVNTAHWAWNVDVHPTQTDVLFLSGRGVLRSDDAGLTFTDTGLPENWVWDLEISPADPNRIFVGASTRLYWSDDGGATWTKSASTASSVLRGMAADPRNSLRCYASASTGGMYRTDDGGLTWNVFDTTPYAPYTARVLPSGELLVTDWLGHYAARSTDHGASYSPLGSLLGSVPQDLALVGPLLYAATAGNGVRFLR